MKTCGVALLALLFTSGLLGQDKPETSNAPVIVGRFTTTFVMPLVNPGNTLRPSITPAHLACSLKACARR
jgi:hypothetical protein